MIRLLLMLHCSAAFVVLPQRTPPRVCFAEPQHELVDDDDDVSQHEFMAPQGYRPIEDWHEEHVQTNPKHVLTQLQQEKAKWSKKFESMSGEGI